MILLRLGERFDDRVGDLSVIKKVDEQAIMSVCDELLNRLCA